MHLKIPIRTMHRDKLIEESQNFKIYLKIYESFLPKAKVDKKL